MKGTIGIDAHGEGMRFYGKFKKEPVIVASDCRVYELADFYKGKNESIELRNGRTGELVGEYQHIAVVGGSAPQHCSMVEAWIFDMDLRKLVKVISYSCVFWDFDA